LAISSAGLLKNGDVVKDGNVQKNVVVVHAVSAVVAAARL